MLTHYINVALTKAVYTQLDDGTYCGKIPECPGTIAFGNTLSACQTELRSVLEDWLLIKLRHNDQDFPILDGIDLNTRAELWENEPLSVLVSGASLSHDSGD